jgi:gliding motility-associated-like protein
MEGCELKYSGCYFRQKHLLLYLVMILQLIIFKTYSQCIDTADFNSWINFSNSWTVVTPGEVNESEESIPPVPNFFVSNQNFINIGFAFDIFPYNSPDYDFVGFVVGYQEPASPGSNEYRFLLFDWKAKAEEAFSYYAEEGFNLTEFYGVIEPDDLPRYFWGHNSLAGNSICDPIVQSYGNDKGWLALKSYHLEVSYTSGKIIIKVDGNKIFDISRCNSPGKIGFYTYSQHNVAFRNFTWQPAVYTNVNPLNICTGNSIFFTMEDSQCGGYYPLIQDWEWTFGDGTTMNNIASGYHIYDTSGNFPVNLVTWFQGDCSDTLTTLVNVQEAVNINLGPDTTLAANSNITLTAGPDQYGWHYTWSDSSQLNELALQNLEHDTSIWVIVSKGLCSGYDEININIIEPPPPNSLLVPNAFTPNGDGINDIFIPVFKDGLPEKYLLVIYNRWGQQLFETTSNAIGWDGMVQQKECPGDTYVYLVKFSSTDQNLSPANMVKRGTLMLVR